ncbi:MAG: hypothetical protein IJ930_01170 [Lachnospiraceae bacterium]|nr:hypothetical protein [Lachnospiraceae bacterium]
MEKHGRDTKFYKRVRFVLECLHVLFTLPFVLTAIVIFAGQRDPAVLLLVYLSGYLLLPAVVIQKKVLIRNIPLAKCILIVLANAVMEAAIGYAGSFHPLLIRYRAGIIAALVIGSVLTGIDTLLARKTETDRQEALRLGEVDFTGQAYVLQKPSAVALAYIFVFYVVGLLARTDVLCNIALIVAVLYLITVKVYDFIEKSEEYLKINHNTASLPAGRILRTGTLLLLAVLLAIGLAAVPAAAAIRYRIYPSLEIRVPEGQAAETLGLTAPSSGPVMPPGGAAMGNPLDELVPEDDFEWPAWINDIVYVLAGIILFCVLIAVIRIIKEVFVRFTREYDDNGDIVETIDPDEKRQTLYSAGKIDRRSAQGGVRYRYKRMIRKNLKGRPMPQETPVEIEKRAGIQDRPDVIKLHDEYELVRYGQQV